MSRKVFFVIAILAVGIVATSCATKRDCNGKRLTYNKQGGFWM